MGGVDEQCIDGVASMAEKEVVGQSPIGLHVPDGGLDGRSLLSSRFIVVRRHMSS